MGELSDVIFFATIRELNAKLKIAILTLATFAALC